MLNNIIHTLRECGVKIHQELQSTNAKYLDSTNDSGDMQLAIDVKADKLIEDALLALGSVKGVCSEEKSEAIYKDIDAPYIVAYDPLDGSSVLESNLSIGTIFGIYHDSLEAQNLVASGYIMYGFRLELVVAQSEVLHYRYEDGTWKNLGMITLSNKGKLNAPGGTQKGWSKEHKSLIDFLFAQGYRLRYSGAMVADLHQILIKGGGLFSYPGTTDTPKGKLRKLFEVFPFALIYEKAGGVAIDDKDNRILDLGVGGIHDTTPCFFGSRYEIDEVRKIYGR